MCVVGCNNFFFGGGGNLLWGMETIKIHVLHCGEVHTSPYLPFDTDNAGMLKVAGIGVPKDK